MGYNWANKYMDYQAFKSERIRKSVLIIAFVMVGVFCQAQTWSDMTYWLSTEKGAKQLAEYAHPTDTYMRHSVSETTSDYIIIEIKYEGIFRNYWCKYKVYRGYYQGSIWFKDITTLSEGTRPVSFYALQKATDLISDIGSEEEINEIMRYFHSCTWYGAIGEYRAAFLLTYDFYND